MGKKQHKQQVLRYELTGLAILAVSALALGKLGLVGRYLDVAFVYLAGSWSFLVPLFLAYAAVCMMVQRAPFQWTTRHVGLLVLFATWLTGMEFDLYQRVAALTDVRPVPLFDATLHAVQDMRDGILQGGVPGGAAGGAGGGMIGYAVFAVAHYLFGSLGTMLVLGFGVLVGGALVTQRSLVAGVQRGTRWMERRLDGLWRACKEYVSVLFGPEVSASSRRSSANRAADASGYTAAAEAEMVRRPGRRRPELIVDGVVVTESLRPESADQPPWDSGESADGQAPVVHDFVARQGVQADVAEEAPPPVPELQQVGNQLVMRYPERCRAMSPGPTDATGSSRRATPAGSVSPYPVGQPVRDDRYKLPPIRMFAPPNHAKGGFSLKQAQDNARKLEMTLESFGVQAKVLEISRGPTVTRYELQPAVGVKVSKIVSLTDDIALALAARGIRIEAPVPGKSVIGIEVPNPQVSVVTLREVLESPEFQDEDSKLALALGRDISGAAIVGNLQKMPHLLVAGATGSGKSVCINCLIASILVKAKPHEVKLLLIDPKMVELSGYNGIPHLLAPVVTDPRKAAFALKKVVQEMETRYRLFAERGARDIERYNQMLREDGSDPLPYVVVIIDELADLMMVAPGEVEDAICRIAQMARAAGIHLIVATQRPSVDVITGLIKANIPSRIAFAVSSMADSRTILDAGGAEKLLGRGDMLYLPAGAAKALRVQGAFVSDKEIEQLVDYVKRQQEAVYSVDLNDPEGADEHSPGPDLDELFVDAVDLVVEAGQASSSLLQRRFRIGYSRAARIIDQMEQQGLVGPFEGSRPREVLVTAEQWQRMKEQL
ncbi:MAG: DNA translocase FtsK [Alicyclobacillaceae bacterium]|nr:DNA translocase FtsK [Alicyclobacillaceae bacterium]